MQVLKLSVDAFVWLFAVELTKAANSALADQSFEPVSCKLAERMQHTEHLENDKEREKPTEEKSNVVHSIPEAQIFSFGPVNA